LEEPTAIDRLYLRLHEMGSDPLPYGIQPNMGMLEYLFKTAASQHILREPVDLEKVFVPSTLDLIA
ncbi:MAG: ABC transporter substrate-binding protein, partial [Gammaproteobacteria bacterium]|nr:ABC transporter substrate-binding protein [Gammaproteobacteria bacterium]